MGGCPIFRHCRVRGGRTGEGELPPTELMAWGTAAGKGQGWLCGEACSTALAFMVVVERVPIASSQVSTVGHCCGFAGEPPPSG
jgi:hypothetical protein